MVGFLEFVMGLLLRAFFIVLSLGLLMVAGNGVYKLYRATQSPLFQMRSEMMGEPEPVSMIGAGIVLYYLIWYLVGVTILFFAGRGFYRQLRNGIPRGAGARRQLSGGEQLRGIVIFGLGGLFFAYLLIVHLYMLSGSVAYTVFGEKVEASVTKTWQVKVTDLPKGGDPRTAGYYAKYAVPYGGTRITAESQVSRAEWQAIKESKSIAVLYFPNDPATASPASLHNFSKAWWFFTKLLIILVVTVIGVARFWECLTYDDSGPSYQRG